MTTPEASGAPAGALRSSFTDLTREPAVRVRLIAGWRIGRSDDGASFAMVSEYGALPPFASWFEAFEPANELLREGAPLAKLRDAAMYAAGVAGGASYLIMLQLLCRRGFLEFPLVDEAGERAVLLPQRDDYVPALGNLPASSDPLGEFSLLRRHGGAWLLESPLCGVRIRMAEPGALEAPLVRRVLAASGFLQSAQDGHGDPRREALRQWEFHDLLFHTRSRNGWHRDPFGAIFPYIGEIEPLPAVRPKWSGERIALPRAPDGTRGEPFASVLERRRSEREYDESQPVSLADLGALLDRCAAVRSLSPVSVYDFAGRSAPFEITRRPYPSGGASYELEIYAVVDRCADLESGCYHYDAGAHELARVRGRTKEVEDMLWEAHVATVGLAKPQVVLVIAARFARVMWKYKAIAYAAILRNVGVLYQTLYLGATELGLSPCGLGAGNGPGFARLTGLDPWVEGSVGEFILGGRPIEPDPSSSADRPGHP